jgi:hypothetical protein
MLTAESCSFVDPYLITTARVLPRQLLLILMRAFSLLLCFGFWMSTAAPTVAQMARQSGAKSKTITVSGKTETAKPTTVKPAQSPAAKPSSPRATAQSPARVPASPPAEDEIPPLDTRFPELFTPESTPTFRKGFSVVNAGLGLLSPNNGYDLFGAVKSTPAMTISYEKGVIDGIGPGTIGLGGLIGYKRYHYDFPSTDDKATWTDLVLMGRGTYHYNFTSDPNLDTYGGISLGFRYNLYKNEISPDRNRYDGDGLHLAYGLFAGARYYLTERFGAFGEVGYDMSYLKVGLTYRIK